MKSLRPALGALLLAAAALLPACGGDNGGCNVDTDCSGGKVCKAHFCLAPGECAPGVLSCSDTSQCGARNVCSSGCCTPVAGCATSADCTDASLPHCNAATNTCEKCTANTQCPIGAVCSAAGRCESSCGSDADCKVAGKTKCTSAGFCGACKANSDCSAATPVCGNGICYGCGSNSDCGGSTPVCNPSSKVCVACLDAQNSGGINPACSGSTRACLNQACVTCVAALNDASGSNGACTALSAATPACTSANTCAACLSGSNALCTDPSRPFCDASNSCGCTSSSQCASGQACDPAAKACRAPVLTGLAASASTLSLGGTATLTATVDLAPASPLDIALSNSGGGTVPAKLTIPAGQTSATSTYTAPASAGSDVVTATLGSASKSVTLTISSAPAALATFTSDKAAVQEGSAASLTVTLTAAPATPATVALTNDNAALGSLSATSTTLSGATNPSPITFIAAAGASGTAVLHASLNGDTKDLSLAVFKVAVTDLQANPASVNTGGTSTLTVTVDSAPPAAATVLLGASAGSVPASVTIPAGQTSATFTFTAASSAGSATITASAGGASKQATVTVNANAATFMVVRVDGFGADGTTSAALSTAAAKVSIEEHSTTPGSAIRTIALPTVPTSTPSGNTALVMVGNSGLEGGLNRSLNGKYVTLAGYSTTVGTPAVNGTSATSTNRVIGRIDAAGNVDTSTRICSSPTSCLFDKGNIRGVASDTGAEFWVTGSNTGVVYTTYGGSSPLVVSSTPTNNRAVGIYGRQLYVSSGATNFVGLTVVGAGLPATTGQTATVLSVANQGTSPNAFAALDTDATAGPDVIYISQEVAPTTADVLNVEKWTLSGSTWTKSATFTPKLPSGTGALGAIGLLVFNDNGATRIVATTFEASSSVPNRIVTFVDDNSGTPAVSILATAPTNSAFRGVALSPTP
jgi:hypothetical protein